ncbi:hypothetical protein [Actinomadura sp. WMMA1423]|uniref:hypothetical protein n=1 Tax=Actinomadura sp. WMMA1423 TaxID=2591108 RepID=UPI001147664C|nr:hypothetical protein [Actinomadura sp. WMMA1423]
METQKDDARAVRPPRGPVAASGLLTLLAAGVGALWSARASSYPFGSADKVTVSVTHLIEHRPAGAMLLAASACGLAATVFAARRRAGAASLRAAGLIALAETLFFGLVMADVTLMVGLAYTLALTSPLIVLTTVAVACARRQRIGYLAAGAVLALAAVGVATGFLTIGSVSRFARNVGHSFANYDLRLLWGIGMSAVAAGWGFAAFRWLRQTMLLRGGGRLPAWATPEGARRWGRVATIAAGLCPLTYGLIRLTWLTPWPIGLMGSEDNPATRMQGAGLGIAAVGGTVLTLGLIARWGERFPRWVPMAGGRPVPPRMAVIPGGVVAAAACVAAPGFVVHGLESDGMGVGMFTALLIFPFPIWGPLLAAAVFAYRLRRGPSGATGPATAAAASRRPTAEPAPRATDTLRNLAVALP